MVIFIFKSEYIDLIGLRFLIKCFLHVNLILKSNEPRKKEAEQNAISVN